MSDTTTNEREIIDGLLAFLDANYRPGYRNLLTALVAERNKLREQLRLANIDQCNTEAEANDRDRDLRERLVCAIWPEIMRQWREYKDAIDPRGCARSDALEEADKMIAAMRKGVARE